MTDLDVRIKKLRDDAILPEYQTEYAAAMDLHACLDKPMTIQPMERVMVPTGLAIEIPIGYEAQIRARSGLSFKHGIAMTNGMGTIDADYRGEWNILVINLSDEPFVVEHGMRIAQMLIAKHEKVQWHEVEVLTETTRDRGGFGSTGK